MKNSWKIETVLLFRSELLIGCMPLLCFLLLYFPSTYVTYMLLLYLFTGFSLHGYVRILARNISIVDSNQIIRLFSEEESHFYIHINNTAVFSCVRAQVSFETNNAMKIIKDDGESKEPHFFSFFINKKSKKNMYIPFVVQQRGIYQIENVRLKISDPFQMISAYSEPIRYLNQTIIVYPRGKEVKNIINSFVSQYAPFSLYTDDTMMLGIKDYEKEPFKQIHWKATSKINQLQVKQFQPILQQKWTISLLLTIERGYSHSLSKDMEKLISYTTFLCQYAYQYNISYELFINMEMSGKPFHLKMNKGPNQLQVTLEVLASINEKKIYISSNAYYHFLQNYADKDTTYILIGKSNKNFKGEFYTVNEFGVLSRESYYGAERFS